MIYERLEVGPLGANCFILGCEDTREGVIIDAGSNADGIIAAVERLGINVAPIISTHGHFDHVGANKAVRDHFEANLLIHQADVPMLERAKNTALAYGLPSEDSPPPDVFLADGMEITFGKHIMKVLHTPGHTQGGCCLYLENEKMVITGDTLFADSIGRTDLPGGSHEQLLESVRNKLFTLPDDVMVFPGHGPETYIRHEKRFNPFF